MDTDREPPPASGGSETPRARIDRLVAEGKITREAVAKAEQIWQDQLQGGIAMPSGEVVPIALDDVYHVIADPRILRKPERIALILMHVFEIREARWGMRRALARWQEENRTLAGYAIISTENTLKTAHVIDEAELRRIQRKEQLVWQLSGPQ